MKNYLKTNLQPLLIGFSVGVLIINIIQTVSDCIIKLALIK